MKKFLISLIFLFSIAIFGQDNTPNISAIQQPILEEISKIEKEETIQKALAISVLESDLEKIKTELTMLQKRMDIIDLNIADRNKVLDELDGKVLELQSRLNEISANKKDETIDLEKNILERVYKISAVLLLAIVLIFIISLSIVLIQGSKNKKMLEEWKDIFEMNRYESNFKNGKYEKYSKKNDDDIDIIL